MLSQQCLGCDEGGDRCEHLPTEAFCLAGQPAPLSIIQPQPSATDLLSKDSIFFAQVIDGILLLLIHPSGHGDEHNRNGSRPCSVFLVKNLLCTWRNGRQTSSPFNEIRFLDIALWAILPAAAFSGGWTR